MELLLFMEVKPRFLSTIYTPDQMICQSGRQSAKLPSKDHTNEKIPSFRINQISVLDSNNFDHHFENNKEFGMNTTIQQYRCRVFSLSSKEPKPSPIRVAAISPEPTRRYSPKYVYLHLRQELKQQKYPIYSRVNKTMKPRSVGSPKLTCKEVTADLPRADGKNLIVHKYARPQALVAIRTPSPVVKAPNILEEKVLSRPHAIFRKGFIGWKISLKSLYQKQLKKSERY